MASLCCVPRQRKNSNKVEPTGNLRGPNTNADDDKVWPFKTFYINFKTFDFAIFTNKGCSLKSAGLQSEQIIDIIKLAECWSLPENTKIVALLVGSIEADVHHKTSYDIRECIANLSKFLVRNSSWLLALGENASFFKCLGHILKNTMFESSEITPAILGIFPSTNIANILQKNKKGGLWLDQSNNDTFKDLDQNINHYIFTSNKKVKIKQSDIFECVFLCNGTAESLEDIVYSLTLNRGVIILKRSGGLADTLADLVEIKLKESVDTLNRSKELAANEICNQQRQEGYKQIGREKILELINEIMNLVDKQVQILDISKKIEETNITEVIFKAVDGAERRKNKLNRDNYIMLCLHLDQLEIAAEIGGLWEVVENKKETLCREIVKESLLLRRYSFIRYLLEQGLSPNEYIEVTDVSPTYKLMLSENDSKTEKKSEIGSRKKNRKMTPKQKGISKLIKDFCIDGEGNIPEERQNGIDTGKVDNEAEASRYNALLFKLAVVEERIELAKIIWQKVDSPTGAALYAFKILKELEQNEPHIENQMRIKSWMADFQGFAIETINRTYNKQPGEAIKLLGQKITNWGDTTCLMLALTSGNKTFLSQLACREFNDKIWYYGSLLGSNEPIDDQPLEDSTTSSCTMSETAKDKMRDFFAPAVLAYFRFISHCVFLIIFAALLISLLRVHTFHWLEWILWSWIGTYLLEQINQLLRNPIKIFPIYPLSLFFLLESISIVMFFMAWGLRLAAYFFPDNPDFMNWARVIFSLDFITFSIFSLEVCCIHSFFGPILLMIMKMFKILVAFLLIIILFFVAYAIASESVLFPESHFSPLMAFHLLRKAFWAMFGEFNLEEIAGQSCTNDPALYSTYTVLRCPTTTASYYVPPLLGVYYIVVNIMLFSLLIALFSSTIEKVSNEALEVWHHQSLQMTLKYAKVIFLPPPFTVFTPFLWLCKSSDINQPFSKEITKQNLVNLKKIEVDEQRNFIQYLDVKGSLPVCKCTFICEHKDSGQNQNESKKIFLKDNGIQTDPSEWVSTHGNVTLMELPDRAESILKSRNKSKEPRKFFAMRSKYKHGLKWKVVSIKQVKKQKKGGKRTVPAAVLPELKYLD